MTSAEPLLPPGFVVGRLVDEAGAPIAGGRVCMALRASEERFTPFVVADEAGRFRLGPLPASVDAQLIVDSPLHGCERYQGIVVLPGEDHDVGDLVVPPGLVICGTVVDPDGRAIEGARVKLDCWWRILESTIEQFGPERELRTDHDGRFESAPLPASGAVNVRIDAPGFARRVAWAPAQAISERRDLGRLELARERLIRGRVVDGDGAPVAGASVRPDCDYDHATISDGDGRFVVPGQLAARWLDVWASGFGHAQQNLTAAGAAAEGAGEVVVTLRRAFAVRGVAIDAESGEPVTLHPRFGAGLGRQEPSRPHWITCVENGKELGAAGAFTVWYAAPTEHERGSELVLSTVAEGYEPTHYQLGVVEPPRDIDAIVMRMRRRETAAAAKVRTPLVGHVVGPDGAPWRGVVSLWHLLDASPRPNQPARRGALVDVHPLPAQLAPIGADGSYRFEDVDDEGVCLRVDRPGHAPFVVAPRRVTPGETATIDVRVEPHALLRGRVVGLPPGLSGHLWIVALGHRVMWREARVDRVDRFELALQPGRWVVRATADSLNWHRRTSPDAMPLADPADSIVADVTLAAGDSCDLGELRLPQWALDAFTAA